MSLVDTLKEKQADRTQMQFAAELGISDSLLQMIYSGERRISPALARRIVGLWSELRDEAADYLLGREAPDPTDSTTEAAG